MFPNPSVGSTTIQFQIAHSSLQVQVSNEIGQIIYDKTHFNAKSIQLDLQLQSGIYFVSIILENGRLTTKKLILD